MNKKGAFLEKRINLFIVFLVIIVISVLIVSNVFYSSHIKDVGGNLSVTLTNLSSCEAELNAFKSELTSAIDVLNTSQEDVKKYDELYEQKDTQLQDTISDLDEANDEANKYTNLYESEKDKNDQLTLDVNSLSLQLEQRDTELIELEESIDGYKDDIDDLEEKVECLEDNNDGNETSC